MLVSLCITSYNQSAYIEDALNSAFAQTYSPLEIVIVDDASTDDTFAKIDACVTRYKSTGGKHTVFAIQNDQNLGVAKNYDKCFRLAHGELLVTGSGDDISLPERCARLAQCFLSFDHKPMAIIHNGYCINANGDRCGSIGHRSAEYPLGAATAYNRKLFDFNFTFPRGVYEDHIYAPVADVLGGMTFLDEMLMEYRVGTGLSSSGIRRARIKTATASVNGELQSLKDIESLRERIPTDRYEYWRKNLIAWHSESTNALALYTGKSISVRWHGYRQLRMLSKKCFNSTHLQQLLFLLPERAGDVMLSLYMKARRLIKR